MFKKLSTAFIATLVMSSVALAAGPTGAKSPKAFERYVETTAKENKNNKKEEEVRKEAIEILRRSKRFSEKDLARIGRGEAVERKVELRMVEFLKQSKDFQVRMGFDRVAHKDFQRTAEESFMTLADTKVAEESGKKLSRKQEVKAAVAERDAHMLGRIEKTFGKEMVTVLAKADKVTYPGLLKLASRMVKQVEKQPKSKRAEYAKRLEKDFMKRVEELNQLETNLTQIESVLGSRARAALEGVSGKQFGEVLEFATALKDRTMKVEEAQRAEFAGKMEQLLIDNIESPRVLNGERVLGKGAKEACLNMDVVAVKNFADFVRGGAMEGKDAITYTRGMARVAATKFKQELEDGVARVCALAGSGCGLFSPAIQKACRKMGARTAAL